MRKQEQQFVLPAQPGTHVLFEDEGKIVAGETVLGYLIKQYDFGESDGLQTDALVGAITIGGIAGLGCPINHFGILHPNGEVDSYGAWFDSLETAQRQYDIDKQKAKEARPLKRRPNPAHGAPKPPKHNPVA
jgi:hypothetical protein